MIKLKRAGHGAYTFTATDGTLYHLSRDDDFDGYAAAPGWEMSVTDPKGAVIAWHNFRSLGEARRWLAKKEA